MNTNKKVLVISDVLEQFALTASLLREEGYTVCFENDVSESLMLAGSDPPNLIISELAGPNVDGLQICRRVREDQNLGTTPVLLVGDLSKQSSIVADGLRCGADDYLQKPIDPLKLVDKCRGLLAAKNNELAGSAARLDDAIKNDILRAALFDNSRTGLAFFSSTGKLVESNAALLEMLDYTVDELRDMALQDFFYPSDTVNDLRALEDVLAGKREHYQFENGYLTPAGETIRGTLTLLAVTDHTESTQFIGIFDEPVSRNPVNAVSYDIDRTTPSQNVKSKLLDFNRWKINKGLIYEN